MIELKNVTKTFDTGKSTITAVDDVSLNVNKGEIYGIIGYSGAGKSTLVRTLNGLDKPTSGQVLVNDKNLSALSGKGLRQAKQKIGMIFQHFNILWSRTVRENIMFPLEIAGVPKKKRIERADELIQLVGLEGREDAYPAQLSGGQKQRVGIARALANEPDVLLSDEATSALDPQTTDDVLNLLLEINRRLGLTIVIITHEMDVIRKICNKVAVMDDGRVVEEGPASQIFNQPKQEITKKFIYQSEDENLEELIQSFVETYPEGEILNINYADNKAQMPVLSQTIKKFDVDINIIHGTLHSTNDSPEGSIYVQVVGKDDAIEQAINYLKERVNVEVLHHD